MSHQSRLVLCNCAADPHALDGIAVRPRSGALDVICPVCAGHGEWNVEIDLTSQRCKRAICPKCDGRGWLETGDDLVPSPDIARSPEGHPAWVTRLDPSDDRIG